MQLEELDKAYGLTRTKNAEIARSWFELVIRNDYRPSFPRLEEYLTSIGRRKLIAPLYEALMKSPGGVEFAKRVYATARPGYHATVVGALDAIVEPNASEDSQ